jgi:hypothetical protein
MGPPRAVEVASPVVGYEIRDVLRQNVCSSSTQPSNDITISTCSVQSVVDKAMPSSMLQDETLCPEGDHVSGSAGSPGAVTTTLRDNGGFSAAIDVPGHVRSFDMASGMAPPVAISSSMPLQDNPSLGTIAGTPKQASRGPEHFDIASDDGDGNFTLPAGHPAVEAEPKRRKHKRQKRRRRRWSSSSSSSTSSSSSFSDWFADRRVKLKEADVVVAPPFPKIAKLPQWKLAFMNEVIAASGVRNDRKVCRWLHEVESPGKSIHDFLDAEPFPNSRPQNCGGSWHNFYGRACTASQ